MKKGGCRIAHVARMVASIVTLAPIAGLNTHPSMAQDTTSGRSSAQCQGDNGGLTLSPGFCASIFADDLGHIPSSRRSAGRRGLREHLEWSISPKFTSTSGRLLVGVERHQRRRSC
jgi:hypothetical protein